MKKMDTMGLVSEMNSATLKENHDDLEQQNDVFDGITDYSEGELEDSDSDSEDEFGYDNGANCDVGFDSIYGKIEPLKASEDVRKGSEVLWERRKGQVLMEGFVEEPIPEDLKGSEEGSDANSKCFSRTKSLTDDDLDELKGCLDLGFGFSYEEIPELCNTLPALELCYSISQKFQDEQQKSPVSAMDGDKDVSDAAQSPIANWKISSPGDHPEEVKARLKFWAQAVACTIRLCS